MQQKEFHKMRNVIDGRKIIINRKTIENIYKISDSIIEILLYFVNILVH